ncbi:MAG: arsenite efflux transporter metallochaperone ArsD [Enterococcus faecium]|uniref:Arsenical resistance operon transcriptional repressor ArsD n=1 Tax=Enterococcus mundtii TaxID=53346 RepID=A0A2T5DF67_ENTMU|nr:arsenite efflux transporter metallochaperone ArsD [Enterococcus mundtii]MBE6172194.1 arsenite efflux transporter metallochaperone ArsD [Enterococcus faecium]PTO36724.1 arsenical resistance operon transcriptional repressor ArsD [Enterococcus mundtii]
MKKLELFESAMCCSTGVCGPSVDETLLMITALFEALDGLSEIEANRYNLTSNPDAFVNNEMILKQIKEKGNDILPITVVDGEIVKTGGYPTKEELTAYTGLVYVEQKSDTSGECCKNSGCC